MSLLVWLPMTKDLSNQGLENITVTNNGATLDTNGKLGKCYSFNGTNNYLRVDKKIIDTAEYSISFWMYATVVSGNHCIFSTRNIISGAVNIYQLPDGIRFDTSNSANWQTGFKPTVNTWYHITLVQNTTTKLLYVNGELNKSVQGVTDLSQISSVTTIGCEHINGSSIGTYFKGNLNDFRIYDHALSAKEVKELSQGLFVHYKLDSESIETNTTVVDSSGFKNNGETYAYDTTGYIECSSDTARYSLSTFIHSANVSDNTTGIRYIYGNCALTTPQYLTAAFWCKPIATYGGVGYIYNGIFALTNNNIGTSAATDYNTVPMHNRDVGIDMCTSTNVHKAMAFSPTANEWHHYAVVYDGRYGRAYKDGVQTATLDMGSNLSLASFKAIVIGYSHAGGVYRKVQSYYSDFRLYATALSADDIKELYQTSASIDNKGGIHDYEVVESDNSRELLAIEYTPAHTATTGKYTLRNAAGEVYFNAASTSCGSKWIEIDPSGKTYYYDIIVSVASGNQFYIGFERFDKDLTPRSNNACIYAISPKPSSDLVYHRYTGTINLSTDGVNPCKYIRLRILNGWAGSTSGTTYQATIHQLSLRELDNSKGMQTPLINKTGQLITDTILEYNDTASFEKKGIAVTSSYIET